jgi:hypothetical protein
MDRSIHIPIANSAEYVQIFPDELPSDANEVIDVLKAECAPLKIWRAVAVSSLSVSLSISHLSQVEYYRQGEYQNFELVLSEIVSTIEQDPSETLKSNFDPPLNLCRCGKTISRKRKLQRRNSRNLRSSRCLCINPKISR